MTDLGSSRPDVDTSRVAYGNSPDPTGWTGWVVFASFSPDASAWSRRRGKRPASGAHSGRRWIGPRT